MRIRRKSEGFNIAFLDIMSCGLGAVVLVFMLIKHNVTDSANIETERLTEDAQSLEIQEMQLQETLEQLQNISQSETESIAALQARLAQLRANIAVKDASILAKKDQLAALKKDISSRPIAKTADPIADERLGEENYLMGLKVQGQRIALLLDSSASMTDESLLEIIKRKNSPDAEKKRGPKWQRTIRTARWLLARTPEGSEITVISFNDAVETLVSSNWLKADNPATLGSLYRELDTIVPEGATNLQKGLKEVAKKSITDLYLITDGLPTTGESRYAGLNPFSNCSSLLGRSKTISGECRVKLFRQSIKDSGPRGVKINIILLPIEGDPDAINEYWAWAGSSGGLVISPAPNWP
jgi:hypothetical protein